MIYFTDGARTSAKSGIDRVYVKLSALTPTEKFTLKDIEDTMYYLNVLNEAIDSEQYKVERERRERAREERKNADK